MKNLESKLDHLIALMNTLVTDNIELSEAFKSGDMEHRDSLQKRINDVKTSIKNIMLDINS